MPGDDLEALISLADYERAAVGHMDPGAHGYVVGGAGDEITLRDNQAAWSRIAIRPRMLVGVGERDLGVELLGTRRPHPLIIAPTAFQKLAHPEGEIEMARAAEQTGSVLCLSTLANTGPVELAEAVPGAARWFQLYVFSDRGVGRELMAQAADHSYEALVVTVDLPVMGVRERDLRSGMHSASADAVPSTATPRLGAQGDMTPADFAGLIDPDLHWRDIEQFVDESPLPVILKGILTPEDARLAAEHGAQAIVVSNHGGRQLDTVLSSADALGPIAEEVGDRIEVIVDGGIRRGTDVLKALALGARAVMIGRPTVWGLAVDGATGAGHVLSILLAEFDAALALSGAASAAALEPRFVCRAPWAPARG